MKKIITAAALAIGLTVAPTPAEAHPAPSHPARVLIGEFESCQSLWWCRGIHPPTRLDIIMWPGNLGGQSFWTRCGNYGGRIVWEQNGAGQWMRVCRGVDY